MNLKESIRRILKEENKKSGLLRAIEEDGLYQVMQDTGLTIPKIYTKTGELPREVLERYIKEYLMNDAYDVPAGGGDIALSLVIELSAEREIESFYLSKGVVTAEINEYDSEGRIVAGSYEKISNLTDKELFVIVDELSHLNDDYFDDM